MLRIAVLVMQIVTAVFFIGMALLCERYPKHIVGVGGDCRKMRRRYLILGGLYVVLAVFQVALVLGILK